MIDINEQFQGLARGPPLIHPCNDISIITSQELCLSTSDCRGNDSAPALAYHSTKPPDHSNPHTNQHLNVLFKNNH